MNSVTVLLPSNFDVSAPAAAGAVPRARQLAVSLLSSSSAQPACVNSASNSADACVPIIDPMHDPIRAQDTASRNDIDQNTRLDEHRHTWTHNRNFTFDAHASNADDGPSSLTENAPRLQTLSSEAGVEVRVTAEEQLQHLASAPTSASMPTRLTARAGYSSYPMYPTRIALASSRSTPHSSFDPDPDQVVGTALGVERSNSSPQTAASPKISSSAPPRLTPAPLLEAILYSLLFVLDHGTLRARSKYTPTNLIQKAHNPCQMLTIIH